MTDTPAGSAKPPSRREDALAIVRRLREAGHVAYFAGGCVRDTLLGLMPKDYDVATDAPPDRVREIFRNTQAVGAAFRVILVRHRKSAIEVATFRTDLHYKDGRSPERIAEELRLMLTPPTRGAAMELLRQFALDRVILRFLPEVLDPVGIFAFIPSPSISFGLALAAIVLDARHGKLPTPQEVKKA